MYQPCTITQASFPRNRMFQYIRRPDTTRPRVHSEKPIFPPALPAPNPFHQTIHLEGVVEEEGFGLLPVVRL